jgi:hypothetical protein
MESPDVAPRINIEALASELAMQAEHQPPVLHAQTFARIIRIHMGLQDVAPTEDRATGENTITTRMQRAIRHIREQPDCVYRRNLIRDLKLSISNYTYDWELDAAGKALEFPRVALHFELYQRALYNIAGQL